MIHRLIVEQQKNPSLIYKLAIRVDTGVKEALITRIYAELVDTSPLCSNKNCVSSSVI